MFPPPIRTELGFDVFIVLLFPSLQMLWHYPKNVGGMCISIVFQKLEFNFPHCMAVPDPNLRYIVGFCAPHELYHKPQGIHDI